MEIRLNVIIRKGDVLFRETFKLPNMSEDQIRASTNLNDRFQYGNPVKEEDGVMCFYTFSLEEHERNAIRK